MRHSSPRHLTDPPRARAGLVGLLVLVAATIVIGGLVTRAFIAAGKPAGADLAARPGATAAPSTPPPTANAPAARPAPAKPTTSSPPAHGSAMGGSNLLANSGFEDGLNDWSATGGGRLELVGQAHDGQRAARLSIASGGRSGMLARRVTRCEPHGSYMATAWVRAGRPGATIELNLIEYVDGRRLVTDVAGHILPDGQWQLIEVDHVAHRPGAELAVEVVADGLPGQGELVVDSVEVRLAGRTNSFVPQTTR